MAPIDTAKRLTLVRTSEPSGPATSQDEGRSDRASRLFNLTIDRSHDHRTLARAVHALGRLRRVARAKMQRDPAAHDLHRATALEPARRVDQRRLADAVSRFFIT